MLLGMAIRVWVPDNHWVPDSMGTGMIFYLMGIFSHPRVTRRVPDTLLPL
jgi:hypothetical protein